MSSFINKFFGFVKKIVANKKKDTKEVQEPEPELPTPEPPTPEPELPTPEPEPELPESEPEPPAPEPEPQEPEPELPEPEPEQVESQLEESELQETEELELPEPELPEPELQEYEAPPEEPEEPEPPTPERKDDYTYMSQKIRNIIVQHYGYSGFMINDTEGYSLFRSYAKSYELELPASDSELRKLIVRSGTLIDGSVYVFTHDDVQRMLCEVQRMLDEGIDVVYFRELETFIDESNLYHNLSNMRAIQEILKDNYEGYIFTSSYMEISSGHKAFRSYMDGLKYILAKYFPDGFNSDYALLREYAAKENIILSGNDKALKRETEALRQ